MGLADVWCLGSLALPTSSELKALRARLLDEIAIVPLRQGDYTAARAYLEEALTLARELDDPGLLAATLGSLGFAARLQDRYSAARSALEEGLALARHQDDTIQTAR